MKTRLVSLPESKQPGFNSKFEVAANLFYRSTNEHRQAVYRYRSEVALRRNRAQVWRQSTDADDRVSSRKQRRFSLRPRRAFSRSTSGAAAAISGYPIRLLGNR